MYGVGKPPYVMETPSLWSFEFPYACSLHCAFNQHNCNKSAKEKARSSRVGGSNISDRRTCRLQQARREICTESASFSRLTLNRKRLELSGRTTERAVKVEQAATTVEG